MRLIDADALDEVVLNLNTNRDFGITRVDYKLIDSVLFEFPTIDEGKKGKWIRHDEVKNIYGGICIECSECGEKYVVQYIEDEKYCRNCGANMRGES
jgi:hypothetical protein